MIKAIYHDGQICPLDPVPADWVDGQSLQVQTAPLDSRLVQEFARLAQAWKRDTRSISSTTEIATHPAYQRIIGLGREVVPLILADLRQEPCPWFWALPAITGEAPVAASPKGKVRQMAEAWIRWGKQKGMLSDDDLPGLEGPVYGGVVQVLRRSHNRSVLPSA